MIKRKGKMKIEEKQREVLLKILSAVRKSKDFIDVKNPTDDNDDLIENFVWIGTRSKMIGNDDCHYEFIFQKETPKILTLEVHIDEDKHQKWFSNIQLPEQLQFDRWRVNNGRIIFKKQKINIYDPKITKKAMSLLKELHFCIGNSLEEIMTSHMSESAEELRKPVLAENDGSIVERKHYKPILPRTAKDLDTKHGEIQKRLLKELSKIKAYQAMPEKGFENQRYKIDVLGYNEKQKTYDIYEVKPYYTAMQCIREALGQIMFYKYLLELGDYKVRKLVIVGPSELTKIENNYFQSLKSTTEGFELEYLAI